MMIADQDMGIKIDCHIKKRDRVDLVPKIAVENKSWLFNHLTINIYELDMIWYD